MEKNVKIALENWFATCLQGLDTFEIMVGSAEQLNKVMRAIVREEHRILRGMNTQYMEMSNYISKQHGRY